MARDALDQFERDARGQGKRDPRDAEAVEVVDGSPAPAIAAISSLR